MSTTDIGQRAEAAVAEYLQNLGFNIVCKNWKTRQCEIDIVAAKGTTVYFVEVKYRASDSWGDGLEYMTATKLRQMRFAADLYASAHGVEDYILAIAAVDPRGVTAFEVIDE